MSEGFDKSREKILEVKQDNYIIKHDINKLLDSSIPFSEISDRFRFLIFLGYNSDHLTEDEEQDYKNNITLESKKHFSTLLSSIVKFDPYFDQLNISIYLYPSPCINTMLSRIKDELLVNIR
ncbi:Hachiman antiphage defense system protein HamA [Pseudomonas sp. IT-P44]|uniref:Hachiman antiphage defense system protein HamA n=1 Tax=Pseudomonas sp. IT-P44 TaxID=3026451 RepID=UPI0039DF675E